MLKTFVHLRVIRLLVPSFAGTSHLGCWWQLLFDSALLAGRLAGLLLHATFVDSHWRDYLLLVT